MEFRKKVEADYEVAAREMGFYVDKSAEERKKQIVGFSQPKSIVETLHTISDPIERKIR